MGPKLSWACERKEQSISGQTGDKRQPAALATATTLAHRNRRRAPLRFHLGVRRAQRALRQAAHMLDVCVFVRQF